MAITKVSRGLLNTGVSDSSDATAITIDSDENIGFNTTGIAAGSTSSASNATATPKKIVINNDYSNGATDASLKLYLYNSGSVRQGFTSGSNYDLQYHNSGDATGRHAFYVGNTESVRIDADGIKFNGDSAAANALDDYEEGTWTPSITGAYGLAYSTQIGTYTKIGKLVIVNFTFVLSTAPTSGSNTYITMPFVPSGSTTYSFGAPFSRVSLTATQANESAIMLCTYAGTAGFYPYDRSSGAVYVAYSNWGTGQYSWTGTYFTDS